MTQRSSLASPPPDKRSRAPWPLWVKVLIATGGLFLAGLALLVLGVFSWLVPQIQQIIQPQTPQAIQQQAKTMVHLSKGAPFKVLQAVDILGIKLVRLEYTRAPQEFVVVSGLDHETTQDLFAEKPEPQLLEAMGNSVLKLREAQHPKTVAIEALDVLEKGTLQVAHKVLPYQRVRLKVAFSDETKPRQYEGVLGRYSNPAGQETILVSYSKAGLYHPELLQTFLEQVTFQE